jgi:two-component system phosphate regulon sensor histidine kinase PhoR
MSVRRPRLIGVRVGLVNAGAVFIASFLGSLLLATYFAPGANSITQRLAASCLIATGVAAVALAVPTLLLAPLAHRLVFIGRAARRFAAGDLRHRVDQPSQAELDSLASSLNTMAAQLSEQFARLRAQQNEQDAILRSMEGGVLAIDAELRVLRINRIARKMLRVEPSDVRGLPLQRLVRDQAFRQFAADAIADPSRRTDDFSLIDAPGLQLRVTSGALLDAEDEPVGAILLLNDITHLKRLESMRADFAANVSHELRTPITNIKGYAETLLEDSSHAPDLQARFLRVIARNAERLGAIVNDMLALTKLDRTDAGSLAAAPTPVSAIVAAAVNQVAREAEARGVRIVADVPPDLRVMANARLAEQAVLNLLANAVKYGPDHASVTLEATEAVLEGDRPAVSIAVADEGPGIPAEHIARIFERFYRVDKARSRERGGTGLGLSIVKHIALVHGGDIDVRSELGTGSVFRLTLPAPAPADHRRRPESTRPAAHSV